MEPWQAFIGFAIFLLLIFQRRFWFVVLTAGSLAAGAESLFSLVHAHFVGALGYAVLTGVCWEFAVSIAVNAAPATGKPVHDGDADHPNWSPH